MIEDEGASTIPSDPTSEAEKAKQTNGHVIGVTKEKESNNTPSSSGSVLQVSLSDYRLAAASLADTFKDDEVARYYLQLPDCDKSLGAKAQRLHLSIYECLTAAHCCAGLVTAAGPNFDAVALWLPPMTPWTWKTYWKSKMWILYWQFGSEGRKRFFGSWDTLAEGMTKIMGERADSTWTLTDLGTRSESRGRGYASRLIRHGLKLVCLFPFLLSGGRSSVLERRLGARWTNFSADR